MKIEIKEPEEIKLPCLMEGLMGEIVLVTSYQDKKYVTMLGTKEGDFSGIGTTWESKVKEDGYKPLPSGYQITLIQ